MSGKSDWDNGTPILDDEEELTPVRRDLGNKGTTPPSPSGTNASANEQWNNGTPIPATNTVEEPPIGNNFDGRERPFWAPDGSPTDQLMESGLFPDALAGVVMAHPLGRTKPVSAITYGVGAIGEDLYYDRPINYERAAQYAITDYALNTGLQKLGGPIARWSYDVIPGVKPVADKATEIAEKVGDYATEQIGRGQDFTRQLPGVEYAAEKYGQVQDFARGLGDDLFNGGAPRVSPKFAPAPVPNSPKPEEVMLPTSDRATVESHELLMDLTEGKGGLTAVQAGATGAQETAETIAQGSIFGGKRYVERSQANEAALRGAMDDARGGPVLVDEGTSIGNQAKASMDAGKAANSNAYRAKMDEITVILGPDAKIPNIGALQKELRDLENSLGGPQRDTAIGKGSFENSDTLSSGARAEIQLFRKDLANVRQAQKEARDWNRANPSDPMEIPEYSIEALQQKMRTLNEKAKEAMKEGKPTTATRQILSLRKQMADFTQRTLDELDPAAGAVYRQANKEYKENLEALYPDVNKGTTGTSANRGTDKGIDDVFKPGSDPEAVKGYYATLDKAYEIAPKNKAGEAVINGMTRDQARQKAERTYLNTIFESGAKDIDQVVQMAENFSNPANVKMAVAVLGKEKFKDINRLMNAIINSNKIKSLSSAGQMSSNSIELNSLREAYKGPTLKGLIGFTGGSTLGHMASRPEMINRTIAALGDPTQGMTRRMQEMELTRIIEAVKDYESGEEEESQ